MKITELNLLDYPTVAFTGDIHGSFRPLVNCLEIREELHGAVVVVCGDIGLGFDKPGYYADTFKWMERRLDKISTTVILFRGNHDNPEWFYQTSFPELKRFKHIKVVDDYTVLDTVAGKVLCIGGALSVDRSVRIPERSYWKNEPVQFPDTELYDELSKIDFTIVATHTCPDICGPQFNNAMGFEMYDTSLMQELKDERSSMTMLYNRLSETHNIRYWMYGHFHGHYTDSVSNTRFIGLDMLRQSGCLDFCIIHPQTTTK